jgi:hypothetical protein
MHGMTVDTIPSPGMYRILNDLWEIRVSERGNWYALRHHLDGTTQYWPSQAINPAWLDGPLGPEDPAQQPANCKTPNCLLPVLEGRDLCGMCLTREVVERANRIEIRRD